jgi:hypothetical protein
MNPTTPGGTANLTGAGGGGGGGSVGIIWMNSTTAVITGTISPPSIP